MQKKTKLLIVSGVLVLIYFIFGWIVLSAKATVGSGIFAYLFFPIDLTILFFGWGGFDHVTIYIALVVLFVLLWILMFLALRMVYRFRYWFT